MVRAISSSNHVVCVRTFAAVWPMQSRGSVAAEFSVYVGNLDSETPLSEMEELLYELFLQAGPLSHVLVPFNKETGKHKCYGFVEFLHKESVPYAITLMNGICLCGLFISVKPVQSGGTSNSAGVKQQQQRAAMASTASATDASMEVQAQQEPTAMTVGQDAPPPPLMSVNTNPFLAPLAQNLIPHTAVPTANVNPFLAAIAQGRLPPAPLSIPPHSSEFGEPPSNPLFTSPLDSRPPFPPSSSHSSFQPMPIFPPPPPHHTFPPLPPLTPSPNDLPVQFPEGVLPFGPPPFPQPQLPSLITPPHPLFPPQQSEQDHFLMNSDIPPPSSFLQLQPLPCFPDLPLYHSCTPPPTPSTPSHSQLHESRLHANDHPTWMKDEVKEQILRYHLKELGTSLKSLHRTLTMEKEAHDH